MGDRIRIEKLPPSAETKLKITDAVFVIFEGPRRVGTAEIVKNAELSPRKPWLVSIKKRRLGRVRKPELIRAYETKTAARRAIAPLWEQVVVERKARPPSLKSRLFKTRRI